MSSIFDYEEPSDLSRSLCDGEGEQFYRKMGNSLWEEVKDWVAKVWSKFPKFTFKKHEALN
jgi:hypothetical protein